MKPLYRNCNHRGSKHFADLAAMRGTLFVVAFLLLWAAFSYSSHKGNTAYAADGDLDPSFGGDGKVTTDMAGSGDVGESMLIQPDGKILVAGKVAGPGSADFGVARYNSDGSLDTSFSGDGKVITDFVNNSGDEATSITLQADGKIVVAGSTNSVNSGSSAIAVARYNTDGSLDTGFDTDGKVTADFGSGYDAAFAVAISSDGKIIVAGQAEVAFPDVDFALIRYNTDGSLDTSFSGDGKVTTALGITNSRDIAHALVVQTDGKIVAAGEAIVSPAEIDFALVRYNTDGSLDTGFDSDGIAYTNIGPADKAMSALLQPDGKIVIAGEAQVNSDSVFGIARYNADGSLDNSLDGDGKATTSFAPYYAKARAVALQADGKIVVAGDAGTGTSPGFALARYTTLGGPDITFSGDGKLTTSFAGYSDGAFGVAVQADGKLVAAGQASLGPNSSDYDFGLTRYTSLQNGQCNVEFTDVPANHTFYDSIHCLFCRAYINGYPCGGTGEPCDSGNNPWFRPGSNVTRGQLAKIVSNSANFFEGIPPNQQSFQDIPTSHTYWPYIERLYSRSIIGGYPCGGPGEPCGSGNLPYFRSNGSASRGQISKIVAIARGWIDPTSNQSFQDVPSGSTFYLWIENLASRSVISGYPCGGPGEPCVSPDNKPYFRPGSLATRGQTSRIAVNTFIPNCQD